MFCGLNVMPRLHNGFDYQERNLTFEIMDFQVLLKFHACNFKQAFYPLHKLYIYIV